jgi:phytoene synthase
VSSYDYCRDKVALPGSSLYYSVLFAPPALRVSLTALHALVEELRQVVDESRDESIARAKLGWWAEEMQRTFDGGARHPVTQTLAEPLRLVEADPARLTRTLTAMSEHLSRDAYRSLAQLEAHYQGLADISGCLAAEFCSYRNPLTLSAARALGTGLAWAALARRPRRSSTLRSTDLPADILAACGTGVGDVHAAHTSPALRKAIGLVVERARLRLRESLETMPTEDHAAQNSRRTLAAIELAQLGALARAGFAVLEGPRTVTPLRKLWIAWNHRRQARVRTNG